MKIQQIVLKQETRTYSLPVDFSVLSCEGGRLSIVHKSDKLAEFKIHCVTDRVPEDSGYIGTNGTYHYFLEEK